MLATPGLERIPVLVRKCPARAGAASRPVSGGSQGSPLPAGGRLPAPQVCPNACASENKADGAHEDHGHGGEKRGGPSIGFPPQQPGCYTKPEEKLYSALRRKLSVSLHQHPYILGVCSGGTRHLPEEGWGAPDCLDRVASKGICP